MVCEMQAVFWLCKENIPLSKCSSLFCFWNTPPHIEYLKCSETTDYSSHKSGAGFLRILSNVSDEQITQKISESPIITLLTDESKDIVVQQKLTINIRDVNHSTLEPSTYFLTDADLHVELEHKCSNRSNVSSLNRNISINKVFELRTAEAAAMTGRRKGLTGQFLKENPHIGTHGTHTHGSAHCVALFQNKLLNPLRR